MFVFITETTVSTVSHPSSLPAPQPHRPLCGVTPNFLGSQPGCSGGLPSPLPPPQAQQPTEEFPEAQGKLGAKSGPGPSVLLVDKGCASAALGVITEPRDLPVPRSTRCVLVPSESCLAAHQRLAEDPFADSWDIPRHIPAGAGRQAVVSLLHSLGKERLSSGRAGADPA